MLAWNEDCHVCYCMLGGTDVARDHNGEGTNEPKLTIEDYVAPPYNIRCVRNMIWVDNKITTIAIQVSQVSPITIRFHEGGMLQSGCREQAQRVQTRRDMLWGYVPMQVAQTGRVYITRPSVSLQAIRRKNMAVKHTGDHYLNHHACHKKYQDAVLSLLVGSG